MILFVDSTFLKCYSKVKRLPAYSRALRQVRGVYQRVVKRRSPDRGSGPIEIGGGTDAEASVPEVEKSSDRPNIIGVKSSRKRDGFPEPSQRFTQPIIRQMTLVK